MTDLSFTQAFDVSSFIGQFTGGVETPPSRGLAQNVALNIAVRSSNNVNLVSRTMSVAGSANLQVRGTLSEPVILGRVNLTGGDVLLNNKRFILTGGTVQFVNPSQTEPNVNLSLTTTIQQYNISLRFQGPIDQLRTQYTSDPSLPSADVINLLAFGRTTEAAAADTTPTNQAAQSLVASQVSNRDYKPSFQNCGNLSTVHQSHPAKQQCPRTDERKHHDPATRNRKPVHHLFDQRCFYRHPDNPGSVPGHAEGSGSAQRVTPTEVSLSTLLSRRAGKRRCAAPALATLNQLGAQDRDQPIAVSSLRWTS